MRNPGLCALEPRVFTRAVRAQVCRASGCSVYRTLRRTSSVPASLWSGPGQHTKILRVLWLFRAPEEGTVRRMCSRAVTDHHGWLQVEGFRSRVATVGSLLGKIGKWGACDWTVVQLDYDEEMEPLYGMYGSLEAEYEVKRTIKREELTTSLCLLRKVLGSIKVHVDNKGIIDGLRKGEKECIKPKAGDAVLRMKIWEELHSLVERSILVEVEHGKAHRTKRKRKNVACLRNSSLKAMGRLMSWQMQEQSWMKDTWQKQEQRHCSKKERRCM